MLDSTYPYLNISYKMLLLYKVKFDYHYTRSVYINTLRLLSQTIHRVMINSKMNFHICCVCIRQTLFYMVSFIWPLTQAFEC